MIRFDRSSAFFSPLLSVWEGNSRRIGSSGRRVMGAMLTKVSRDAVLGTFEQSATGKTMFEAVVMAVPSMFVKASAIREGIEDLFDVIRDGRALRVQCFDGCCGNVG